MKETAKVFLLMGQSNMSGRGDLKETILPMQGVWKWGDGWVEAVEPLHEDLPKAALGLAPSFAEGVVEEGVEVGLVATAVGGTPLSRWEKGGDLYEAAIAKAKACGRTIDAVLWHQGESDCEDETLASTYLPRFTAMVRNLRMDLDHPTLPIIIGELGPFLPNHPKMIHQKKVRAAHAASIPSIQPATLIPSGGLSDRGDSLHMDAPSLKEFGKRYYAGYKQLTTGA